MGNNMTNDMETTIQSSCHRAVVVLGGCLDLVSLFSTETGFMELIIKGHCGR